MTAELHQLEDRRAQAASEVANFLPGVGEMASLIRAKDWSKTPLGPIAGWPQSLRTAVSLCLASNFPINLIWGPQNIQIYNDGYRVVCGEAHPAALGQGYDVTWASAWPAIGEPFARARKGETSFLENQRMFLTRNGYLEETFFTFSLSPIRDESGEIGGLFHPVTETTQVMLAERRVRALRDLTANVATSSNLTELASKAVETLAGFEFSLPFVLFYRLDADSASYRLTAHCGVEPGTQASPVQIAVDAAAPWPFAQAIAGSGLLDVDGVRQRFRGVPCGPFEEGPDRAVMAPIRFEGCDLPPAIVVLGVSPRRAFDDTYRGFYELLANSLAAAFRVTRAREDERRRAEALAAIDRAKTMFFSNVSHEFRTPLTLMLGPIEDILAGPDALSAAQRERLDLAHRNALRLLKLVNTLLDFSRIEAGRAQACLEPTDLAALTADLASNFRSLCERAGLTYVVDCSPLSRPVHVDRDMWEKIVLNLVSNAFKFTLRGKIDVSLRETATGIELRVRDSGVGIPAGSIARLFERFHRVEGQRGRTHEGTGIGLSLVRELIALHGGSIDADSVEGLGSTFRVKIPFGAGQTQRVAVPAPASVRSAAFVEEALGWMSSDQPIEAANENKGSKARVVLADDNADMRKYVQRILQSGDYDVEAVADGAAALAAARRLPAPDLVLCDVMMPELNGFALLKAIRAEPGLESLPVVMLSARAGEEARVEGLAAGADDYLIKPFSARELRARIDSAITLGRQRGEAAARDRAANIELERRVAERTADLLRINEQLHEASIEGALTHRALMRSQAEFRASFEGAAVGKAVVEPATRRILRANRAFADMLGYRPEEMVGLDGTQLTWPEDRESDHVKYTRHIDGEADAYFNEKRYTRRDGEPIWTRVCASLVRVEGDHEQAQVVVATIEDIDARHKAEEQLLAANQTLERVVTERTAALDQRDILLREVYHRVKNNLQVIDSLLTMQVAKLDNPQAAAAITNIRPRIYALGLVHHQLMGSSDLKTFDVAPFLRQLLDNILNVHLGTAVSLAVDAVPLKVDLDFAIPLGMIVTELVTNSLKHAFGDGGGKISVALGPNADGFVVLTVSDDGCGQKETDARTPDGAAIGFKIVKGLVRQIGGTISVRNHEGTTTEVLTNMRAPT
jgi:PAS domain S-box-containing protein